MLGALTVTPVHTPRALARLEIQYKIGSETGKHCAPRRGSRVVAGAGGADVLEYRLRVETVGASVWPWVGVGVLHIAVDTYVLLYVGTCGCTFFKAQSDLPKQSGCCIVYGVCQNCTCLIPIVLFAFPVITGKWPLSPILVPLPGSCQLQLTLLRGL